MLIFSQLYYVLFIKGVTFLQTWAVCLISTEIDSSPFNDLKAYIYVLAYQSLTM